MISQRELGKAYKQDSQKLSTRYEGLSEHNPSHYVLLQACEEKGRDEDDEDDNDTNVVKVIMLPTPYAVQTFSQPARVATMSLTEAELAIANQRSHMTRYMLHGRQVSSMPGSSQPSTKQRLLGKLKALSSRQGGEDDDEDDVMGDVKFSTRKGAVSRARKELLSSLADGVTLDADGVMGGTNDSEFGGKRRFLQNSIQGSAAAAGGKGRSSNGAADVGVASNDGNAMADDFYQRDVKAEYEEMDYDPNEQFDDDDVDLGEGELNVEGGFAGDVDSENDFDDEDDDEEDEEKKAGLATLKGLKDMLAKARGETIEGEKKDEDETVRPSSPSPTLEKKDNSDEGARQNAISSSSNTSIEPNSASEGKKKPVTIQFDEFGQRLLTLEGVRYEIFLHNKSIAMKKLMKLYNIKKKTDQERIKQFQAIIKELCIMERDPVQGNMLILKQHYSKAQV
jgi:hypothetical protein